MESARKNATSRILRALATAALAVAAVTISSCGGSSPRAANSFNASPAGYVQSAGLEPQFNTSAATKYSPSLTRWHLYNGTRGWNWISAIGSASGLSASMSNPFKEIAIGIIPTDTYNGAGKVDFYIDGEKVSSLDLSSETPFEGYSDSKVTYFTIASDLPETPHTVTMIIATGTIAFDGWRMLYKNSYYIIDASEINTHIDNTIKNTATLRAAIEEYYHAKKSYPNPSGDLATFLYAQRYLNSIPANPFTGDPMTQSATDTYSAGDFRYTYTSPTEYELEIDGGSGPLITLTPNSATTDVFDIKIDAPLNHTTTTQPSVTFTGSATLESDSKLTICCGLSGEMIVPITSGPFSIPITLKEGRNDININLSDGNGNTILFGYTITKDTTPPTITVTEPYPLTGTAGNQTASIYSATSTLEIYAEASATVTFNGQTITESTTEPGVFSSSLNFQLGANTITITATDLYNNKSTLNFTINRVR